MSETLTVCENLTQDFSWLPNFVSWVGEVIQGFGPVLALFGALYVYFKKQDADRADAQRNDRRELYGRFLAQANLVWNHASSGPTNREVAFEQVRTGALFNELQVIAPDSVVDKAAELRMALGSFAQWVMSIGSEKWGTVDWSETDEGRNRILKIVQAEQSLVKEMKRDLQPQQENIKGSGQ